MLPRQLPDLTSPATCKEKPSLPVIMGGAAWPSPIINGEGGKSPVAHLFPFFLLLPPCSIASSDTNGAVEEVLRRGEGEGPSRRARLSYAQAWTWPSPQAHRGPPWQLRCS